MRLVETVLSRVTHASAVPFEFRVLESLLEATTLYFEKRAKRVQVLLESVIADINAQHRADSNVSEFQRSSKVRHLRELLSNLCSACRLFPIRRALTEMLFDVRETREAIAEVCHDVACE